MTSRIETVLATLIVRTLIRAYPKAFRERFGDEMMFTFRQQYDGRAGESAIPLLAGTIVGLLRGMPEARTREARARAVARQNVHTKPGNPMRSFVQDTKYAARSLLKQPVLVVVAALTLALGIGSNTAVFSVLNSVILSPLPYATPEQLVRIYGATNLQRDDRLFLAVPYIAAVRDDERVFSSMAISYTYREIGMDLQLDGAAERVRVVPVNADYFATFGATPLLGRTFRREEERSNVSRVVLSHALWERLTGSDRNAVGTSVTFSGVSYEVIGVMRPTFRDVVTGDVAAWTPQNLDPAGFGRGNNFLTAVARLAPNVTIEQAQAQLDLVMRNTRDAYGEAAESEWRTLNVIPLHEDVVGESSVALYVLMGAAGLVLLIACLNVANLFLVRGIGQHREIAIRSALGAARGRLIGQRLAESLLVAIAGGAIGSAVAYGGVRILLAVSPASLARSEEVGFDPRLLGFSLLVTLLTGLFFGAAPAFSSTRVDPADVLHDGGRGNTGGPAGRRVRGVLVSSQIALALIILVGAVTLMRSFVELKNTDLGFNSENVTTFEVNLPVVRYDTPEKRAAFHQRVIAGIQEQPGIASVAAVSWLPANGDYHDWGMEYVNDAGEKVFLSAQVRITEGTYFSTLQIPMRTGRAFAGTDLATAPPVAIINESVAKEAFGTKDAIGREFLLNGDPFTVVGVSADAAVDVLGRRVRQVFVSHSQFAADRNWPMNYLVSGSGGTAGVLSRAREVLSGADPNLVLHRPRALDAALGDHRARRQFVLILMAVFAVSATALAAVGLYGVMSYIVVQGRREIGVRMALGAPGREVRGLVVRHAAALAGVGIVAGAAGVIALAQVLESLVVGVSARDPLALVGAATGLAIVALVAAMVPAWRATRVDPIEALRAE